jgi:hypothetical protein
MIEKEKNSFDVQSLQQTFWKKICVFEIFVKGITRTLNFKTLSAQAKNLTYCEIFAKSF